MKGMTLDKIAKACDGELFLFNNDQSLLNKEALSVVIDSRKAEKDGIFFATRGARVDGHDYIQDVFDKEVLGVVCEQAPSIVKGSYILVKDSFDALKKLAKYYKEQLDVKTVGIIGSVGKTSTKELVASVIKEKYNTVKTIGNFNNEIGVPLTIFSIKSEHEAAIIEMGISDFGEMSRLGDMVKPDICVMTNIGPCHLEFLHDLDGVLKAKTEVFDYMKDEGVAILNGDDLKLSTISLVNGKPPVFYGKSDRNSVYATDIIPRAFEGTDASVHTEYGCFEVRIPIPGEHMVDNALAATAVGLILGLNTDEIKRGIESAVTIAGRSNVITTDKYTVVDDCYNANPKSMKAAISLLSQVEGRKVAILGDMFELGEEEKRLHREIGDTLIADSIDVVLLAGELSENIKNSLSADSPFVHYEKTTDELINYISSSEVLEPGDTILIKASHGMNYSKIVEYLTK